MTISRRQFVALSAPAMLSLGALSPRFLRRAAAQSAASSQENILVVVQLSGGNDGLNTVVPHRDDEYRKRRPTLALPESDLLTVNDDFGLHPALTGFAQLYENGQLGIIQGVGYANPNRSHFEAMDIWHTCLRKSDSRPDGWLGRTVDDLQSHHHVDVPALHLGNRKQPFALSSREHRVPSIKSLEQFRLELEHRESLGEFQRGVTSQRDVASPLLDFVQTSTDTAINVSQKLQASTANYKSDVTYPDTELGRDLKTVAQLINADLATRIFYVELDGFDTHSQQADAHTALLRKMSEAVSIFTQDMIAHGHGRRVLTVCFSEFGRRVEENASKGTDHGTAAPMFIAGENARAGLIGDHPSLTDLEQGDLKFHTDFRQVYAGLLEQWLGVASPEILHGTFKPVAVVKV